MDEPSVISHTYNSSPEDEQAHKSLPSLAMDEKCGTPPIYGHSPEVQGDHGSSSSESEKSLATTPMTTPILDGMVPYSSFMNEGLENIAQYRKGGFHPVHIGDVLDDRFEVVNKLGSGGFGIVWLCRDKKHERWRAVKIMMADHSAKGRDTKITQHLKSQASVEELLENHIAVPLEEFWIEGPNGSHHCFVMPVLGSSVETWRLTLHWTQEESGVQPRAICRQIVKALDFLHRHGVCHGDFRPKNILMQVEGIDNLDNDEVQSLLRNSELRRLPKDLPGSGTRPDYCVVPILEDPYIWDKLVIPKVAVIDYGESFLASESKGFCGIPKPYAAPELLFGVSPSIGSDIWSLACTFYRVRTCWDLFDISPWESAISDIVCGLEFLLGPLPEPYRATWYEKGYDKGGSGDNNKADNRNHHGADDGQEGSSETRIHETKNKDHPVAYDSLDTFVELREKAKAEAGAATMLQSTLGEEKQIGQRERDDTEDWLYKSVPYHKYRYSQQEIIHFADLLECMLKWDPAKRMALHEVIRHPWLEGESLHEATEGVSGLRD